VRTLLGLREQIAMRLRHTVRTGTPAGKASALFLMGELGLVQCKDILRMEKDWQWEPDPETVLWMNMHERRRKSSLLGTPAKAALDRAQFPEALTVVANRARTDIAAHLLLRAALEKLNSPKRQVCRQGEDIILKWYQTVCRAMDKPLRFSPDRAYSDDVKVTAAYLLGEFRAWSATPLLRNVDLPDKNNVSARLPGTLQAANPTVDDRYPCVVALVKMGRRAPIGDILFSIQTREKLSQATRDRLARLAVRIDKYAARNAFDEFLWQLPQRNIPPEKRQARIRRLGSVRAIIYSPSS